MKRVGIVVVLVCVAAAVWWFMRPQPVPVALVTVARGPVTASVANTRAGTVDACRRAGLSPARGGQIERLPVADGDRVDEGDLLLELWNDDIEAQLTLAERDAQVALSRARESCVLADVAQREAQRLMSLRADELVAEEAAESAAGKAESQAAACAASRDAASSARAQVDVVAAQLEQTRLVAPFAGVIAEINGEVGEFVTPSPVGIPTPPTVDLIDASCLYVSAPIDEVDAPRVAPGQPARISLDAFPGRTFSGHVRRVAPYVLDREQQARTVDVEAVFDDPPKRSLLPGYSADVEVILDSREDVLRIPTPVVSDGNTVLVFDGEDSTVHAREIQTGISNWEYTEVTGGLAAGERVVSSVDREGVVDGARVEPE